jgi:nucleotide-binding universal stress UspA family protein
MKAFKSILFPIDFSDCSKLVFPFALDMAKKFDATLHLLFVARDISYLKTIEASEGILMNAVAEVAQAAENQMHAFSENEMGDFPNHKNKVEIGNPSEQIIKYCVGCDIDLIVMGTHGRRGLDRTFMGSVADYVIKNATVPVLTVNPFRPKVKYVHT